MCRRARRGSEHRGTPGDCTQPLGFGDGAGGLCQPQEPAPIHGTSPAGMGRNPQRGGGRDAFEQLREGI